MYKIRVLIIDDSSVVRKLLSESLARYADIEVVGTASDPFVGRERIIKLRPDVVTLDIEMPRMDGLTFLAKLMKYYPLPVIIVSSLSPAGSSNAIRALELGAVEVVSKPESNEAVPAMARLLAEKIRVAAQARLARRTQTVRREPAGELHKMPPTQPAPASKRILAIGASTGGTEAIASVLQALPNTTPGILIVQHMPPLFTYAFARRLNEITSLEVHEAKGGEIIRDGTALVAPGEKHLLLSRSGADYVALVKDGPEVFHQRPSVEVLFNSVAKHAKGHAVGVLLTGMGVDGAQGLLAMREAGGRTIAQDEATSVVYGMPKAAADLGAAESILALKKIPAEISAAFRRMEPENDRNTVKQ